MKVFKVIVISIIALILLTLGGFYMNHELERQYMLEVARSEEIRIIVEKKLLYLDQYALTAKGKITSYKIQEDKLQKNPMGGIYIRLVVNDDSKYDISILVNKNKNNELAGVAMTYSTDLQQLLEQE